MRYSSIRGLFTIGVLACVVAGLPAAQSQPPQPQPQSEKPAEKPQEQPQPPRFRADVNLVRVDAYPLRDGKPVFDLKAEEFEVFEDGVLQKIATFEHVVVRPAGPQTERIEVELAARIAPGRRQPEKPRLRHLPRHTKCVGGERARH